MNDGENKQTGSEKTIGKFQTEDEACLFFDEVVKDSGLFRIYKEVWGKLIYHRHWKEDKRTLRIDRILIPHKRVVDSGWELGIIGVEIKKSDTKIGPPLAQSIDYLDSVFYITDAQWAIQLSHVFLFPVGELHNNIASVCAQSHLGQCEITRYKIHFKTGESTLFYYDITRDQITCNKNQNGKKIGSR